MREFGESKNEEEGEQVEQAQAVIIDSANSNSASPVYYSSVYHLFRRRLFP